MRISSTLVLLMGIAPLPAQTETQPTSTTSLRQSNQTSSQPNSPVPTTTDTDVVQTYKVNVVRRTTNAINYRHRSGDTKVDLKGTDLLPGADGDATVSSKFGRLEVDARFYKLPTASQFGPEYMTYVFWAISPEGRPINLGELVIDGNRAHLRVTTDLQAFGLIVTAEPYFAVTQPSNVVVIESVARPDTKGKEEAITARYELLERGEYSKAVDQNTMQPFHIDPKAPYDLYEARNAVRIAKSAGAEKYAPDSLQRAQQTLDQAEAYQARKNPQKKVVESAAREAVQMAEDARLIALRKKRQEEMDQQHAAAEQAKTAQQQAETQQKAEAERRAQAELQTAEAERAKRDAQQAADRAAQAQREADTARQAAVQQQQQLTAEAERARQAEAEANRLREQSEQEKQQLRTRLLNQLNTILQTRDTARGLIVNMSDVLFDTGSYTLRPGARERLAKVAGVLLGYPDLKLQVEGHTDSVGSDAFNQTLSEKRAESVKDYLVAQGVSPVNITAQGFGKTQPVVSNASAAGRQQNRRVELVVSGDVIGSQLGAQKGIGTRE